MLATAAEKLDLLLAIRERNPLSWRGRLRPELVDADVTPGLFRASYSGLFKRFCDLVDQYALATKSSCSSRPTAASSSCRQARSEWRQAQGAGAITLIRWASAMLPGTSVRVRR